MPRAEKPFVIVVAIDYSEIGELAFDRALELAAATPHSKLHVLHVLQTNLPALPPELEVKASAFLFPTREEAAQKLADHVEKKVLAFRSSRAFPVSLRTVPHLRFDAPAIEIAQLATDLEADLVVVGTHGRRALSRITLGSVAEVAVRLSPCPVLVVRPKAKPAPVPTIESPLVVRS